MQWIYLGDKFIDKSVPKEIKSNLIRNRSPAKPRAGVCCLGLPTSAILAFVILYW